MIGCPTDGADGEIKVDGGLETPTAGSEVTHGDRPGLARRYLHERVDDGFSRAALHLHGRYRADDY
jgi:hypothetical protein